MSAPAEHPIETILRVGLKRLIVLAVPWSLINLVLGPGPEPFWYVNIQLVLLQLATFALVVELAPLTDRPWFRSMKRPWLASAASLIAAAVGFAALLTLATSAGGRYDVSLQFLQLLSSMDIAWVVAAIYLGSRVLWPRWLATSIGIVMIVACVASIAMYLDTVGFAPGGGWLVDGEQMLRIVLPADTFAAVVSIVVFLVGGRKAQAMAQAKPQS